MTEPHELAEAAARYADAGLEVFPVDPATKAPRTRNGMKDATTDADTVAGWWRQQPDSLIGCRISPEYVVLDIDPRHGGDTTWHELQEAYAAVFARRVHVSGRGDGGAHYWFERPPGKLSIRPLDKWAERNGTGSRAGARRWSSGIDILHHDHRYTILPPSPHPDSGKPYLWRAKDAPGAMPDFLADLITAPTPPPPAPAPTLSGPAHGDSIADWYTEHARWNTILEPAGWEVVSGNGDEDGSTWRHPNATGATSASIKHGCLFVYSPNTDFEVTEPGDPRGLTRFAAYAILHHRGDQSAAARCLREARDGPAATVAPIVAFHAGDGHTAPDLAAHHIPAEFWDARPELARIRQAAHSRLVSADAALISVLARAVTLVPPNVTLPAIVGGQVSLNLFGSIIDPSGGGKSAAVSVARQLVPIIRTDIVDPILPSSGEGLIEAFMGWVDDVDDDGKKVKERRQTKTAGFAWVDEGQGLLAQATRSGSTIMETIRSAWMGGDLGQHNASEDRKRWLAEHRYRLCMMVGFQLHYAAHLISDGEGGTPQRFTFALGTDPSTDPAASWPGEIVLERWPITGPGDIDVDTVIADGIRRRRLARTRGDLVVDPLDTHADLRRLKLAAALGVLDRRLSVTADDWELAGIIDDTSCAVRSLAIEKDRGRRAAEHATALRLTVERAQAVDDATVRRATEGACKSIARRVWRDGPMTLGKAWGLVGSTHRRSADQGDVLALAIDRKWLSIDGENLARGAVDPR